MTKEDLVEGEFRKWFRDTLERNRGKQFTDSTVEHCLKLSWEGGSFRVDLNLYGTIDAPLREGKPLEDGLSEVAGLAECMADSFGIDPAILNQGGKCV